MVIRSKPYLDLNEIPEKHRKYHHMINFTTKIFKATIIEEEDG